MLLASQGAYKSNMSKNLEMFAVEEKFRVDLVVPGRQSKVQIVELHTSKFNYTQVEQGKILLNRIVNLLRSPLCDFCKTFASFSLIS